MRLAIGIAAFVVVAAGVGGYFWLMFENWEEVRWAARWAAGLTATASTIMGLIWLAVWGVGLQ